MLTSCASHRPGFECLGLDPDPAAARTAKPPPLASNGSTGCRSFRGEFTASASYRDPEPTASTRKYFCP